MIQQIVATSARGERLGPYEIVAPIGAGGTGEVYRAPNTRPSPHHLRFDDSAW